MLIIMCTWMRSLLFVLLLSMASLTQAADFKEKTCPIYLRILPVINLNGANGKDIDWVISAIAETMPEQIKPVNVRVVTPQLLQYVNQNLATKKNLTEIESNYLKILSRTDYILLIKWQNILDVKNTLTLQLQDSAGNVLDVRSMDVEYLKNQLSQINSFVRGAAQDYGNVLANQFYCIRITPQNADIPVGEKQEFAVQVENLQGNPVSGETVNFAISDKTSGTITSTRANLVDGQAKTIYEQKNSSGNILSAYIQPKSSTSEQSQAIATIQSDSLSLINKKNRTAKYNKKQSQA